MKEKKNGNMLRNIMKYFNKFLLVYNGLTKLITGKCCAISWLNELKTI